MNSRPVEGRQRPACGRCGFVLFLDPKVAVAAVVVRGRQVLLGRKQETGRGPVRWTFPAGYVERGERLERAVVREVKEETGLEVTVGPLVGVYSEDGETVVLVVYGATGEGQPTPGDDLVEVRWFSLEHLPLLAYPHDNVIVRDYLRVVGESRFKRPVDN